MAASGANGHPRPLQVRDELGRFAAADGNGLERVGRVAAASTLTVNTTASGPKSAYNNADNSERRSRSVSVISFR